MVAIDSPGASQDRLESIRPGNSQGVALAHGVWLREFVSKACGAQGLSTGSATFDIDASIPYHKHPFSEAISILSGTARVAIEGRRYSLEPHDSLHVPAGVAHEVTNCSEKSVVILSAFASAEPSRKMVEGDFVVREKGHVEASSADPESIVHFSRARFYELSEGVECHDLFAGRLGSVGICGGYGRFRPGASLPCRIHQYDESITIIQGEATCWVQGELYRLSGCDTAFIPGGRPHRFLNRSDCPMAMVWVYAASELERTVVDSSLCDETITRSGRYIFP